MADPRWEVAFQRKGDIWMARADGSHLRRLVANGDHPYWSPDGKRLAFTRGDSVWFFDMRTGKSRRVTSLPRGTAKDEWSAPKISWDPTQPDIVVASRESSSLHVVEPESHEPIRSGDILRDFLRSPTYAPAWSPSGRTLAFARSGDIWVAHREHPRQHVPPFMISEYYDIANRLAPIAEFNDAETGASLTTPNWVDELTWTRDERRLVFHFQRMLGSGLSAIGYVDLKRVANSEGSHENFSGFHSTVHWVFEDGTFSPRICPDGKTLSYVAIYDHPFELTLSDWTGKATRVLMRDVRNPDWRPVR